jgi:phosphomannomutase
MDADWHLDCFKAYDVRGQVPGELDEGMAELIGRAYARLVTPRRVAVGHDIRLTSPALQAALVRGLTSEGVDVVDIGLVGTEQVYFATFALHLDGGIMVTASHNPRDYNGMKFTRSEARPISADTGLKDIEAMVAAAMGRGPGPNVLAPTGPASRTGAVEKKDISLEYIEHLLTYIEPDRLKPLKIVVNAGNGGAGQVLDQLETRLPLHFVKLNHEPDGSFPHGVPNPLLPENRAVTAEAVVREGADLGLAWDGDFDRCFFFDDKGEFIEGYYLVGLLAQGALKRHPGGRIVHDPRLVWNTLEVVEQAGGVAVESKSGHAFIKERMRNEDAVYGGEMSAHHYFKEFSYADSGMIPWLQIVQTISETGRGLSDMVKERMRRFPVSGEINRVLADPPGALARLKETYGPGALKIDEIDGFSFEYAAWRCNVRMSNTEPVVRVNLETRADEALLQRKTEEILEFLEGSA